MTELLQWERWQNFKYENLNGCYSTEMRRLLETIQRIARLQKHKIGIMCRYFKFRLL